MNKFYPDRYFDDIYMARTELFRERGIKGIIFDIDNTLAPYEDELPNQKVRDYLSELEKAGIKIAFVSNNHKERVEKFNVFGYYADYDAGKPSKRAIAKAMARLGTTPENTALCGDQIFTDIYAGKRMGLFCVLVKPIKDKKTLFFRTKRLLEKPILKRYMKIQNDGEKT